MALQAVTLDFHNTIARCDRWFALEIRELVPAVLRLLHERGIVQSDEAIAERARAAYRLLRQGVMTSGVERDAVDCALATIDTLGLSIPAATVEAAIEELMREALDEAAPIPGVIEAIGVLQQQGLRLGVVSSAVYHPFLDWTLEQFGVHAAFSTIITSASSGYYKSHPAIYQAALNALGVRADEAIHVGDSYRFDVEGAGRAGMRAIWYASTELTLAQPDNRAAATIGDLATLPTVLATLTQEAKQPRSWWRR